MNKYCFSLPSLSPLNVTQQIYEQRLTLVFPWAIVGFDEIALATFAMQSWPSMHINFLKDHFSLEAMFWRETSNLILFIFCIWSTFYLCTEKLLLLFTIGPLTSPQDPCLLSSPGLQLPLMITKECLALPSQVISWKNYRQGPLWGFGEAPDSPHVFQRHILFQAPVKIIAMDYL